jgi:hypothetical protein
MLGRKALAVLWILLIPGFGLWAHAQDTNPKLAGQDSNTRLSKATLWIGSGSDRKGKSPRLNLLVFTKDHKTKLASLQQGELCKGACNMQSGESSQPIPATVDSPSSTFQECQGFESYFFINSSGQDPWSIDWVKVQLEFENGANLVSYSKVNRSLTSTNSDDVFRNIETTETNPKEDDEGSVIHWNQRPAF